MRLRIALLILLVSLLPRVWLFVADLNHQDRWFTPDSAGYRDLGRNLLHGRVFSQADKPPYFLDFERVPVYPLFVAGVFAASGDREWAVVLAQILLSAATCWLLYLTARRVVGEKWALAAALAQALSLSSIVACQFLLTETLFTFLLAVQLWLAFRYKERGGIRVLILAGVVLGLMTLCRPISLLWIIPQCFILLCETRVLFPRRLFHVALSVLIFAATVFPWYLRNRIQDGAWFLTTNTGYTLFMHNVAALEARRTGQSAEALRAEWNRETEAEFAAHTDRYRAAHEQNAYRVRRARALIRRAPLLYARLHFQPYILLPNITAFFELIGQTQPHRGTLDVLNRQGLAAAARHYFGDRAWLVAFVAPWIALLGLIYLGVCLGLARWLAQRRWIELLFFLAFAVYYLLLPGPVTLPRYREPAMPMMILTAAAGFAWVFARRGPAPPGKNA